MLISEHFSDPKIFLNVHQLKEFRDGKVDILFGRVTSLNSGSPSLNPLYLSLFFSLPALFTIHIVPQHTKKMHEKLMYLNQTLNSQHHEICIPPLFQFFESSNLQKISKIVMNVVSASDDHI